jgi:hypothetical protein
LESRRQLYPCHETAPPATVLGSLCAADPPCPPTQASFPSSWGRFHAQSRPAALGWQSGLVQQQAFNWGVKVQLQLTCHLIWSIYSENSPTTELGPLKTRQRKACDRRCRGRSQPPKTWCLPLQPKLTNLRAVQPFHPHRQARPATVSRLPVCNRSSQWLADSALSQVGQRTTHADGRL